MMEWATIKDILLSVAALSGPVLGGLWAWLERRAAAQKQAKIDEERNAIESQKVELDHQKQMDAQSIAIIEQYKQDRVVIFDRLDASEAEGRECEKRYDACQAEHRAKDVKLATLEIGIANQEREIKYLTAKVAKQQGVIEQMNQSGCGVGGQCRIAAAADSVMRQVAPPQPINMAVNITPEHAEPKPEETRIITDP